MAKFFLRNLSEKQKINKTNHLLVRPEKKQKKSPIPE
jgi:hypothetical protein